MNFKAKLAAQIGGTLLALPLLYVASSGPVFRYASRTARHGNMARKELYPSVSGFTRDPVQSFYEPMFWAAQASHLERPLFTYLRAWDVYPMRAFGHVFVLVVPERKQ